MYGTPDAIVYEQYWWQKSKETFKQDFCYES